MDRVEVSVYSIVAQYAKRGLNGASYIMQNPDENLLGVISQSVQRGQRHTSVSLLVRFASDLIVIEHDANSHPLYESLVDAGIPRERIVLAYAGETIPDSKPIGD